MGPGILPASLAGRTTCFQPKFSYFHRGKCDDSLARGQVGRSGGTVGGGVGGAGAGGPAQPRYTLTGSAGAPRAPVGQERHRGPLGPDGLPAASGRRAGLRAGAGRSCSHSRTWLTARTGALGRRVRGCPGDARTPAAIPRDPCRPGTTFPTLGGRQRAPSTRAVVGEAEPGGVAPGAWIRARGPKPIRTPRGGGRWPRDVTSIAEPGRTVLRGRASGAGPSPEWMVRHTLTPGDLRDLRVEPIKSSVDLEDSSILMNISWILRADASIRLLKATKICVMGKSHFESYSCIRCNYTQAFQTQTRPSGGKWMFSYIGFPVELNTVYFIGAHNIPNANMNEDGPSMAVNFTSPGCLDPIMKYKKKCIEAGSLWKPNITACKKSENTVEVNFTTSPLGDRYMALIQNTTVIGTSYVSEKELTRTSMVVHVTGESEGAVVQLTPYFRTCGNDCIRQRGTVGRCPQTGVSSPQDHDRSVLGGWLPLLLSALLVATWVLVAGIYLIWRHEQIKKTSFSTPTLLPSIKVLVVYPSEICFHHTVCYVTEFLQNRCRSEVILEKWQKKKIAEMGPVQWLTTQKQAADKVIFLLSNDNTMCDGTCDKNEGSPCANSQDLFHLAFNLFCSDLRSQAHLRKYVVVSFREGDIKDDYSALRACPAYRLTQDAADLCAELLHAKRRVSVGRRLRACHYSCLSL